MSTHATRQHRHPSKHHFGPGSGTVPTHAFNKIHSWCMAQVGVWLSASEKQTAVRRKYGPLWWACPCAHQQEVSRNRGKTKYGLYLPLKHLSNNKYNRTWPSFLLFDTFCLLCGGSSHMRLYYIAPQLYIFTTSTSVSRHCPLCMKARTAKPPPAPT